MIDLDEVYLGNGVATNVTRVYKGTDIIFQRGGGGNDPLIDALLAQAVIDGYTPFSGTVLTAADVLIKQLVTDGIINAEGNRGVQVSPFLDALWLMATNGDSDFACYDILNPATGFNLTKVNSPVYTSLQGFAGDGVSAYLDTSFNLSSDGVNYQQNNASVHAYVRNRGTFNGVAFLGAINTGLFKGTQISNITSSNVLSRMNNGTTGSLSVTSSDVGLMGINRSSSILQNLEIKGVEVGTNTSASALPTLDMFMLGGNINGSPAGLSDCQISVASLGGDLSSKVTEYKSAIDTYMTTLGTNV